MNKILQKIQEKLNKKEDILSGLKSLSSSELNSFLLEIFRLKSLEVTPSELMHQFRDNRFVTPSDTDIIGIKEIETEYLKHAVKNGFKTLHLSPLAPFGSSSFTGLVHQNNVVSALRGTEAVSDATNILALKIADDFIRIKDKQIALNYATAHRHVRGQYFTDPNFSAHFSVFCMASGGFDTGNFTFEISQLKEHLKFHFELLNRKFSTDRLTIRFYPSKKVEGLRSLIEKELELYLSGKRIEFMKELDTEYYKTIRFKIFVDTRDQQYDLADGGDVDWTIKLLGNQKHRLFISGTGIDLMQRIVNS